VAVDKEWAFAEGLARTLATSPHLAAGDLEKFYRQATRASQDSGMHMALLDPQARQLLNTAVPYGTAIAPPNEKAITRVHSTLQAGQPRVPDLIAGRATGKYIAALEFPATTADGRTYLITSWLYATQLKRAFPQEKTAQHWLIGIFDAQGTTVVRNRGDGALVGKKPRDDLLQAILKQQTSYLRNRSRDGEELYTVLARSPKSGWTVAVGVPVERIEATARHAVMLGAGGLLAALAAATFAAWYFGRRLARAILQATNQAAQPGLQLRGPLQPSGVDEVDMLQDAMLRTAEVLQRHEHERNDLLAQAQASRQVAEIQNSAKDEFLAMLGHELRNPLSAIASGVAVLDHPGAADTTKARTLEIVRRQCQRLTTMVDELLDASRVMTGKVTLSLQPVDLGALVQSCVSALALTGTTREHQLTVEVIPVTVNGDTTRLGQIIHNLLENACKYTAPGGQIWVQVSVKADQAVFSVRDSGIGIENELLPRVFDVFVQGKASLDRSRGGLGIGLAVVQAMVQLHGGTVRAQSAGLGQGTEFTVFLPMAKTPLALSLPVTPAPETPRTHAGGTLTVLVVDDNEDGRRSLAELLKLEGIRVVEAATGQEAVHQACDIQPDVALVDIGLPDFSGYEVASRLRRNPLTAKMRLLALSGYGQASDRNQAEKAGFDGHLTKPVQMDTLLASLTSRVQRGSQPEA
jgi:signal transduction histidine kinase/ActR/RegA family two-component response regulator